MLNKVMIIGRLGRDPELRYSQSGSPVCTLNIATDESYTCLLYTSPSPRD